MSSQKFRAISFDAAGTLIHLAEPVGDSYSRVAARYGIKADAERLSCSFRTVWKRTHLPFSPESSICDPDEKSWWRRLVRVVFEDAGAELPDGEIFNEFFEALYTHFESPGTWIADLDATLVLEKVGSHYSCLVISNFDARLRRIFDDLDLLSHFENVILSCEVGASKPDPRIFQTAAMAQELEPETILHVGDDPVCDWEGAPAAGFGIFKVGKGQRRLVELLDELSLA